MFVVLDTNHFRELGENSALGRNLTRRIEAADADVFTCIVAVEETLRGWMAVVRRSKPGGEEVVAYRRLQRSIEALIQLPILAFDEEAAGLSGRLRKEHPQAGTMDLKIASICVAHDALLLTRNVGHFKGIHGLRVENWLD